MYPNDNNTSNTIKSKSGVPHKMCYAKDCTYLQRLVDVQCCRSHLRRSDDEPESDSDPGSRTGFGWCVFRNASCGQERLQSLCSGLCVAGQRKHNCHLIPSKLAGDLGAPLPARVRAERGAGGRPHTGTKWLPAATVARPAGSFPRHWAA